MQARVLTVIEGGTHHSPVLVDVCRVPGPSSLVVEGIRLHDLAGLATLLRKAFTVCGIPWPMVGIRARMLPRRQRTFPADATLAVAVGLLAAQSAASEALGVVGRLGCDGTVSGLPSQPAISELLGHCDRVLAPSATTLVHARVTPIATLADVHRVLTMTNGPP